MAAPSHYREADAGPDAHVHPAEQPLADIDNEYSPHYVHPGARRLFAAAPFMKHIPIFSEATTAYGPRRVGAFGLCYLMSKGVADNIIWYAIQPLFMNRYGIDGERYQRLSSVAMTGWSIKSFTAMWCDAFAIFGYSKRWYMFASALLGGIFALILGLLPAKESSANTACAFVFLCCFGKANVDILTEGFYSRLLRRQPKAGSALVSWIWGFIMVGAIIAAAIQGPLSDSSKVQNGIFASAALQIATAPIFLFNLYGERTNSIERWEDALALEAEMRTEMGLDVSAEQARLRSKVVHELADHGSLHGTEPFSAPVKANDSDEQQRREENALVEDCMRDDEADHEVLQDLEAAARARMGTTSTCLCGVFEVNRGIFDHHWKIFAYSVIITCAVIAMTCGNILADTLGLLIICVIVSTVCCASSFWALPLVIAKANVFGYLQQVLYIQLPGALYSFYLADSDCVPGGPNFSYTFYNTVSAVIGNIAGLAGVAMFTYIFSKHSYPMVFVITTSVQILASIFDIIMVKRWNQYIGIPDHAMYILGDQVVYQVCYYFAWMPIIVLMSRMCPRGSESMVFGVMNSFSNMGQTTSSSIGAVIMEYGWGIVTSPPCDFSNVPWLVFVCHLMVPLLILPLTLLLPRARLCDDIDADGNVVRTELMRAATKKATAETSGEETHSRSDRRE